MVFRAIGSLFLLLVMFGILILFIVILGIVFGILKTWLFSL
jgi:hypothetical protein